MIKEIVEELSKVGTKKLLSPGLSLGGQLEISIWGKKGGIKGNQPVTEKELR